jgi:archaellin
MNRHPPQKRRGIAIIDTAIMLAAVIITLAVFSVIVIKMDLFTVTEISPTPTSDIAEYNSSEPADDFIISEYMGKEEKATEPSFQNILDYVFSSIELVKNFYR